MNRKYLGKVIFVLLLLVLVVAGQGFAQQNPYGKNTDVYYECKMHFYKIDNFVVDFYDRLSQIEVIEPFLTKIKTEGGLDVKEDVLSWFGDRVRFGILGDGDYSPIRENFAKKAKLGQAEQELSQTVRGIENLKEGIEKYKKESGNYPESLEKIKKNKVETPRGGYYTYKKLGADGYEIGVPAGQFKDLGLDNNEPRYSSADDFSGRYARKTWKMDIKNMVLAIDVKNLKKLNIFMVKLEKVYFARDGKSEFCTKTYRDVKIRVGKHFCYAVKNRVFLVADRLPAMQMAIKTMDYPETSLTETRVFKDFLLKNTKSGYYKELLFVNLDHIKLSPKMLKAKGPVALSFVKSLYYLGYAGAEDSDGIALNVSLATKPGCKVLLFDRYFAGRPAYKDEIVGNLPAGLPMAGSFNVGEIWNMLSSVRQDEKGIAKGLEKVQGFSQFAFGMTFEGDILNSTSGEIAFTIMPRDLVLSGIVEVFNRARRGNFSGDSLKGIIAKGVPMTFFIIIKDPVKANKVIETVAVRDDAERIVYKDVTIYKVPQGAICLTGDLMMIHTFPSTIYLKKYIDSLQSVKSRLWETTNYRKFRQSLEGRVLAIQYQDNQWTSQFAQSFMMMVLPEFSDYADLFGKIGQTWKALTITPDSINLNVKLYWK